MLLVSLCLNLSCGFCVVVSIVYMIVLVLVCATCWFLGDIRVFTLDLYLFLYLCLVWVFTLRS